MSLPRSGPSEGGGAELSDAEDGGRAGAGAWPGEPGEDSGGEEEDSSWWELYRGVGYISTGAQTLSCASCPGRGPSLHLT